MNSVALDFFMGISNLLPILSPITNPRNIKHFRGCTVGVDSHVWLHRSIYIDPESQTSGANHISYFTKRAQAFLELGVTPVFVFDGEDLPAKQFTNRDRMNGRSASLARAVSLKEYGDHLSARDHIVQATDVSEDIVGCLVRDLRAQGYDAVVAPYEADAQLSFMGKEGLVDFVIPEDSDLLVYGCPRVWYKFDTATGYALEVKSPVSRAPALAHLSEDAIILACILAGCDYRPRIPGIGLKRALDVVGASQMRFFSPDGVNSIVDNLMIRGVAVENKRQLISSLTNSYLVFRHQTIFNPANSKLQPLNMLPTDFAITDENLDFIGRVYDPALAIENYHGKMSAPGIPEVMSISMQTSSI